MEDILIVGASIAGLSTAYWLARYGFSVTIVELHAGLRKGGQPIDIRGTAIDVIERMGLWDIIQQYKTDNLGFSIVNSAGEEIFRSEEFTFSGGKTDSTDIEILRDDLVQILADATFPLPGVRIRFSDTVESLIPQQDGVLVKFSSGQQENYWAVIGADGVNSRVRRLSYPDPIEFFPVKKVHFAIWSTDNFLGLQQWQKLFSLTPAEKLPVTENHSAEDRAGLWNVEFEIRFGVMTVRQDNELRVFVSFPTPDDRFRSQEEWKEYTCELLEQNPAWISVDLVKSLTTTQDFYCDKPVQVRLPMWHQDRIALVGDAAHCPSPFTGQGSSLALIGAYVLAGELRKYRDPAQAFTHYHAELAAFVLKNQESFWAYAEDPRGSKDPAIIAQWEEQISGYTVKEYSTC